MSEKDSVSPCPKPHAWRVEVPDLVAFLKSCCSRATSLRVMSWGRARGGSEMGGRSPLGAACVWVGSIVLQVLGDVGILITP